MMGRSIRTAADMHFDEAFGQIVKEYRLAKNWTQAGVAQDLGFSREHLVQIESGRNGCTSRAALRLCVNLGIPLERVARAVSVAYKRR
jgi:transcriptional regulator with XRE-family HTH domain